MKKSFLLLILSLVLLALTGCGKAVLNEGDNVTDVNLLIDGKFKVSEIDTSFIGGDYYPSAAYTGSDRFSYVLSALNSGSSDQNYFLSFEKSGKIIESGIIDMPINVNDGHATYSSVCTGDVFVVLKNIQSDEASVYYKNFSFDDNGNLTAVCGLYLPVFTVSTGKETLVQHDFIVTWDKDGKCTAIEETTDYFETAFYETADFVNVGDLKYKYTESGICVYDKDDNFVRKYFDFVNSGLYADRFEYVSISDDSSFSGIYKDADGKQHLACFSKDNSSNSSTAILLACSGLSIDMKKDVIDYNLANKNINIAVVDYSDMAVSGSKEEGWTLLKSEINAGFTPDMIVDTTGFDKEYIDNLSSEGKLVDLKKVVFNDKELEGFFFNDNAIRLFYSADVIYAVVPSFSFRTVVGNNEKYSEKSGWGTESFISANIPIVKDTSELMNDARTAFLIRTLEYNGNLYINKTSGSVELNSAEFISLLEFAKTLPYDYDSYAEYINKVYEDGNYDYILGDLTCRNLGDMHLYSTKKALGDYVFIGFPGGNSDGSGVIAANESYMIFSSSAATNDCWKFVKHYLSKDYQESITDGIPVSTYGYSAWKNNLYSTVLNLEEYNYSENGESKTVSPISPDKVNYIEEAINSCRRMQFSDYTIEQIVLEYANQYFDGKITSAEAAQKIDEEVEAYLKN